MWQQVKWYFGYNPGTQIYANLLWAPSIWLRNMQKYCELLHCSYYNMDGVVIVIVIAMMHEKSSKEYPNAKS